MSEHESNQPDESLIRAQLERILASAHFTAAEGASKLLRFLVEAALAGRGQQLKEYTLAVEVFGRDATFDPKTNPAVRVEASRLRQRLERYYLTLGRADAVLIELPRGSYAPVFLPQADVLHLREDLAEARADRDGELALDALALPPPGGPCIAVLPFENLENPAETTFAAGITVEIVTALSRFREFRVLGRSTVSHHLGTRDARKLHQVLGADYVLTGNVRRADQRLRVNAELVNGTTGVILWAEGYERDLSVEALLDIQADVANHVVSTIAQPHGVIARPESDVARRKLPESLDAYDCLLLFYDYTGNHSPEGHLALRTALEAELGREPGSASLWAALSMVHTDTWRFSYNVGVDREDVRDEALRAARQAVKLDPLDSLGYHALFLAHFARGNFKAFRQAADRAVELNPNNVDILADYGLHLALSDDALRGRLFLKLALSFNPEPPDWYWFPLFIWHFEQGEFDAALDMALRSQSERFFWTHGMHALAYEALGMHDQAAAAVARLLEVYPDFPRKAREELGRWGGAGRTERALALLRQAGLPVPPGELGPEVGSSTTGGRR